MISGRLYQAIFPTKSEAQRWVRELVRTIELGGTPDTTRLRLSEWLEQWMKMRIIAPRTRQRDEEIVRKHLVPAFGHYRLSKLRRGEIEMFVADLAEKTSPATALRVLAVLRAALGKAKEQGLILSNPCEGITVRTERYTPSWRIEDIKAIVDASSGTRMQNIIVFALTTGMRMGEIIALRWDDIDWLGRQILVRYQVQWTGNQPSFVPPKSASGRRNIVLDPYTEAVLRDQQEQIALWRQGVSEWHEYNLVFPTLSGVPWRQENLGKEFRKIAKRAGITYRFRFHDLRHAHITLLAQAGVPIRDIQARVGHADARTTYEVYTHALQAVSSEQVRAALGTLFSKKSVTEGEDVAGELGQLPD